MKKLIIGLALFLGLATPAFSQQLIYKGATVYKCMFRMVDSTDTRFVTGKTGLSPTFTISKNGGAFAASHAATITEISGGWYVALLDAIDTPTDGFVAYRATGSGADESNGFCGQVTDVDMRGASPTPSDIASAIGDEGCALHGTPSTIGEGVCQSRIYDALILNASGNYGTAQAGASTTITLDALYASAIDNTHVGERIYIYVGSGGGQTRFITAYNGTTKVATVNRAWVTNPSSSSKYVIIPDDSYSNKTIKKGVAFTNLSVWMRSAAGAAVTGLSTSAIVCKVSIDNGSFATTTDTTETEVGFGKYVVDLSAPETNGNDISIICSGAGASDYIADFITQQ